ncbi:MAG TPA: NB-ARC domain-containing protein [Polyangiaceae bacterium]|nr:NB-ARC domain-containing protein [Polyangiaceae bacterium]
MTESVLSSSVTTVIGPGGVGKTALATTVAATISREELSDGVAVVWLAPLRSAELVTAEVATAIGLTKLGGLSYEDAIVAWLADKDVLLVLDNCEHVVSAVADLVDSLTAQLPRLRILATSREPLWVDGEVSHRLAPLPLAGQLHRMAVFAGGFDLPAINGICATEGQSAAQVADLTARLVEKSLFMKLDGGRYQLLETIRQYSLEQLGVAGELDAVRDRHARFYLEAALLECNGLTMGPERPHLEVLRRLEDNVRVALARLLQLAPLSALELSAGLTNFWWTQGKLREGIGWLEQARTAATNAPPELRASGLFCEGFLVAHDADDWVAAARLLDVGIDAVSGNGDPPPILGMLYCLRGECDVFNGDPKSAVVRTEIGLEMMSRWS